MIFGSQHRLEYRYHRVWMDIDWQTEGNRKHSSHQTSCVLTPNEVLPMPYHIALNVLFCFKIMQAFRSFLSNQTRLAYIPKRIDESAFFNDILLWCNDPVFHFTS